MTEPVDQFLDKADHAFLWNDALFLQIWMALAEARPRGIDYMALAVYGQIAHPLAVENSRLRASLDEESY